MVQSLAVTQFVMMIQSIMMIHSLLINLALKLSFDTLCITESGPVACKCNNNDPDPSVLLLHEAEDYFSDAFELPEDVFYDAQAYTSDGYLEPPPPLVALWDVYPEDPFVFTNNEVIVGTNQAYFNVSVIGNIETLLFDGYSPVDSGADTVYCGGDCVNEEIYHNREVHVIGVHGDDNKPSFQIGTNLTTVHGEDGERYLGRFPESIYAETGKTLLSANQIRNAGHIVNDVPLKYGGKQYIKCLEGPVILLYYKQGLCQMNSSKPTQTEIETLAGIDFTLDLPWDPTSSYLGKGVCVHSFL